METLALATALLTLDPPVTIEQLLVAAGDYRALEEVESLCQEPGSMLCISDDRTVTFSEFFVNSISRHQSLALPPPSPVTIAPSSRKRARGYTPSFSYKWKARRVLSGSQCSNETIGNEIVVYNPKANGNTSTTMDMVVYQEDNCVIRGQPSRQMVLGEANGFTSPVPLLAIEGPKDEEASQVRLEPPEVPHDDQHAVPRSVQSEPLRVEERTSTEGPKTPNVTQAEPRMNGERRQPKMGSHFRAEQAGSEELPVFEGYEVERLEGSGGYSNVFKARRLSDGKIVAIKQGTARINQEIKILGMLGGKHRIVKMEGFLDHPKGKCIVLEYIEHDKLLVLKTREELRWYAFYLFKALNYMHQMKVMHRDIKPGNFLFSRKDRQGYLIDFNLATIVGAPSVVPGGLTERKGRTFTEEHRILSKSGGPRNAIRHGVLVEPLPTSGRRELLDFVQQSARRTDGGAGKRVPAPRPPIDNGPSVRARVDKKVQGVCCGTRSFIAPEVLLKSGQQTVKVDIWSAGVTLLQLATGKRVFPKASDDQTLKEIAKLRGSSEVVKLASSLGQRDLISEDIVKSGFKGMPLAEWAATIRTYKGGNFALFFDLIERCLQVDPEKRITAHEAMLHDYFSPCLKARSVRASGV